ncbi:hypothetical protein JCM3770_005680 [Rhodotorula araucariae]
MATQAAHAARPQTLDAALARIHHLERQLALATELVRDRAGLDLGDLLDQAAQRGGVSAQNGAAAGHILSNGTAPPPPRAAVLAASSGNPAAPSGTEEATPETAAEPVDVGPYVLRALALRKRTHLGEISDAHAEEELAVLFEGDAAGLTEEQRATVRQWAGL